MWRHHLFVKLVDREQEFGDNFLAHSLPWITRLPLCSHRLQYTLQDTYAKHVVVFSCQREVGVGAKFDVAGGVRVGLLLFEPLERSRWATAQALLFGLLTGALVGKVDDFECLATINVDCDDTCRFLEK